MELEYSTVVWQTEQIFLVTLWKGDSATTLSNETQKHGRAALGKRNIGSVKNSDSRLQDGSGRHLI